ncbi:MAG: hypothetical protein M3552_20630 [Planctomycetota bacterium]|nr:hypothetical protein [Planctomycetaceae bacterium]MDQ3333022.1 hypothetical protein [Planctomycetota bacterium]
MTVGEVVGGDVTVSITLKGPTRSLLVKAAIDTGFKRYLTLPPTLMQEFGHGFVERVEMVLADGSPVICNGMVIHLTFGDRPISVLAVELGTEPLIGMAFLEGYRLTIDVTEGGKVSITPLRSSTKTEE